MAQWVIRPWINLRRKAIVSCGLIDEQIYDITQSKGKAQISSHKQINYVKISNRSYTFSHFFRAMHQLHGNLGNNIRRTADSSSRKVITFRHKHNVTNLYHNDSDTHTIRNELTTRIPQVVQKMSLLR